MAWVLEINQVERFCPLAADRLESFDLRRGKGQAVVKVEDLAWWINRGNPWAGRDGVTAMAEGFYADVPDLRLTCDGIRLLGDHMVFLWTFTGHHSGTHNPLRIVGCEEWDLDAAGKIAASRGWYDGADYARQVAGG